jgi:hypothetical protein
MADRLTHVLLWLFVLNLGIAFGAGLYESRISVPQWLRFAPDTGYRWKAAPAVEANVGLRFWVYVTTVPLTVLTLLCLIRGWTMPEPSRTWWLVAGGAALIERLLTFGYFIPTMIRLMREELQPESAATTKARQWVRLGYVRQLLTLIAWLAALHAFGLLYRTGA